MELGMCKFVKCDLRLDISLEERERRKKVYWKADKEEKFSWGC
jgi:hypothetical protein